MEEDRGGGQGLSWAVEPRGGEKCYGDKNKEDECGRACNTHGRDQKYVRYFDWKTGREVTTRNI
jgi:hypothetical protein